MGMAEEFDCSKGGADGVERLAFESCDLDGDHVAVSKTVVRVTVPWVRIPPLRAAHKGLPAVCEDALPSYYSPERTWRASRSPRSEWILVISA